MPNGSHIRKAIYILLTIMLTASCYREKSPADEHDAYAEQDMTGTTALLSPERDSTLVADSLSFYSQHHYGIGYNFIVHNDSLYLIAQQPEEHVSQLVTDSFTVGHDQRLAVMDVRIVPQDSIDSVWVQLISEEGMTGWIHESRLLPNVVPTDPISQFIMFFSDSHLIIALTIVGLLAVVYVMRTAQKRNAPIVHFRDIPSFYPTLLCIIVAISATFYASLQMFGADTWRHFYYHPSLNPFILPPILAVFIASVWAMLIVGVATVEDVRHHLHFEDAVIYLAGLAGVCGILYIVFSISTLYYIGYPLLIIYIRFAVRKYKPMHLNHYLCGNCGKRIYQRGRCPHCGAVNE